MSHAIEICGLQKSYGNHIVLHDISCCILQGEIFGLLGVNGSGKTQHWNALKDCADMTKATLP